MASYEPTVWAAGDNITSAKLNKLEEGVANSGGGGVFIVNIVPHSREVTDSGSEGGTKLSLQASAGEAAEETPTETGQLSPFNSSLPAYQAVLDKTWNEIMDAVNEGKNVYFKEDPAWIDTSLAGHLPVGISMTLEGYETRYALENIVGFCVQYMNDETMVVVREQKSYIASCVLPDYSFIAAYYGLGMEERINFQFGCTDPDDYPAFPSNEEYEDASSQDETGG